MTRKFVPLDSNKHRDLKFSFDKSFDVAKESHLVALSVKEFGFAAGAMPIVFIKHPEHNKLYPAALLSAEAGKCLYQQNGKWLSHYVPLNVQRYPFDIQRVTEDQFSIFIDENSALFGTESGEALFDSEGKPTQYLQNRKAMLEQITESEMMTPRLIEQLEKHDLFIPAQVSVAFEDGEAKNMVGMYILDERKVQELSDEAVLELYKTGAMAMIYAALTSLSQLNRLIQLSQDTDKPIRGMQLGPDAQEEQEGEKKEEAAEA